MLNRPAKINCMNGEMYRLLEEAIEDYANDDGLRCLVISGAGGNFSSGGDLEWFRAERLAAKERGQTFQYDFPAYRAMDRLRKPVIAAIDGYCVGSGFNLALFFCDIRIATPSARLGNPAVLRGLNDAGNRGAYPMPHTWYTGLGNALYLMLLGEYVDADTSLRMSLINEIVEEEQILARATELAEKIAKGFPELVQNQKVLLKRFQEVPGSFYGRLREIVYSSANADLYLEGTAAFFDRNSNQPSPGTTSP